MEFNTFMDISLFKTNRSNIMDITFLKMIRLWRKTIEAKEKNLPLLKCPLKSLKPATTF